MKDIRNVTQIVKKRKEWGQCIIRKNGGYKYPIHSFFMSGWKLKKKRGKSANFLLQKRGKTPNHLRLYKPKTFR
jgi:hypothetical protein